MNWGDFSQCLLRFKARRLENLNLKFNFSRIRRFKSWNAPFQVEICSCRLNGGGKNSNGKKCRRGDGSSPADDDAKDVKVSNERLLELLRQEADMNHVVSYVAAGGGGEKRSGGGGSVVKKLLNWIYYRRQWGVTDRQIDKLTAFVKAIQRTYCDDDMKMLVAGSFLALLKPVLKTI